MSPLPSRYYKILLPLLVFGAAALLCISIGYKTLHEVPSVTPQSPTATTSLQTSSNAPLPRTTDSPSESSVLSHNSQPATIPADYIHAKLVVGNLNYELAAPASSTVETSMTLLEKQNPVFTFTEKEFPSLGQFVSSINGKVNASGYYWFFSVNGTESNSGISQTVLHPGDVIEWKYEHA